MFNYRKDKTGFFATLILGVLFSAMVIATLVLLFMGVAKGQWDYYNLPIRFVLGIGWLLLMATVLTRVAIFRMQMLKKRKLLGRKAPHADDDPDPPEVTEK